MKAVSLSLLIATFSFFLYQVVAVEAVVFDSTSCSHGNQTHNYYFGQKRSFDKILYHDHINYKSSWLRVVSVDVTYPPKGQPALGTISYIEALDQRTDGTGGCVYIRNGGVGQATVTLHVKTQRNHGMEFFIRVWGL